MQERLTKEMQKTLESTEEDMKLAIEERELQKMAALSQSDAEKDGLREQLGRLTEVREKSVTHWLYREKSVALSSCDVYGMSVYVF